MTTITNNEKYHLFFQNIIRNDLKLCKNNSF